MLTIFSQRVSFCMLGPDRFPTLSFFDAIRAASFCSSKISNNFKYRRQRIHTPVRMSVYWRIMISTTFHSCSRCLRLTAGEAIGDKDNRRPIWIFGALARLLILGKLAFPCALVGLAVVIFRTVALLLKLSNVFVDPWRFGSRRLTMLDRRPSCGIVLKTQMQILNATKLWLECYIKAGLPESRSRYRK